MLCVSLVWVLAMGCWVGLKVLLSLLYCCFRFCLIVALLAAA